MEKKRLLYIDQLRGFVMLTVVLVHLHSYAEQVPEGIRSLMSVIGNFRMPLFFFVSGYIINKVTKVETVRSLFKFYGKKILNLLLPAVVWTLLVTGFFFTRTPHIPTSADLVSCLCGDSLWFLNTLFFYMLPLGLFKLIGVKMGGGKISWFILVSFVLVYICLYIQFGILKNGVLYYFYFVMGIVFSQVSKIDSLAKKDVTFLASLLIFCFASGYWISGHTSVFNLAIRIISAISGIGFFYNLVIRIHWNPYIDKSIRLIGVNTLSIYVAHWYLLGGVTISPNWYLALLQLLFYSMLISLACIGIAKIASLNKWLNLLFYGKVWRKN